MEPSTEEKLRIPRMIALVGIPIFSILFVILFFGAGTIYISLNV